MMMEQSGPMTPPAAAMKAPMVQPRGRWRGRIFGGLMLLLAGGAVGGWATQTWLDRQASEKGPAQLVVARNLANQPAVDVRLPDAAASSAKVATVAPGDLGARVALLESRLATMAAASDSMTGNALRAEGVLLALAARRALDRGMALGPLESQLQLRFADAQPNAVKTVIEAARTPVTLDRLQAGLDQLAPRLIDRAPDTSLWRDVRDEVGNLFTVRRAHSPSPRAAARVERARRLLDAAMVDRASREIAALPSASLAADWLAEAARYHEARRALDLIETAAILAPTEPAAALVAPTAALRR